MSVATAKAEARREAFARRKLAHAAASPRDADALDRVLARHSGRVVSGYMPIRTEIDPRPAMAAAAARGPVCVPVIEAMGRPLRFAAWRPDTRLVPGPFGAHVPEANEPLVPEVLVVPLVAFDRRGGRLGYGGGFYDRTLAELRARGPVVAIGFAFSGQEAPEPLPLETTDAPLDLIVTEAGIFETE